MQPSKTTIFDQLKAALEQLAEIKTDINNEFGKRIQSCDNWTLLLNLYAEDNIRKALRKFEAIRTLPVAEFFYLGYLNTIAKNNALINAIETAPEEHFRDFLQNASKTTFLEIQNINATTYHNLVAVFKHKRPAFGEKVYQWEIPLLSLLFCDNDKEFVRLCDEFASRGTANKNHPFVTKTIPVRDYVAHHMKLAYADSENKQIIYDFINTVNTLDKQILTEPLNPNFGNLIENYDTGFNDLEKIMCPDYNHAEKLRNDKIKISLYITMGTSLVLAVAALGLSILMPATAPIAVPLAISLGAICFGSSLAQYGPALLLEMLFQCTIGVLAAVCTAGNAHLGAIFIEGSIWDVKESKPRKQFGDKGYRGQMMTFFESSETININMPKKLEEPSVATGIPSNS